MEALEKIQAFLKRLEDEAGVIRPRVSFLASGYFFIQDYNGSLYFHCATLKSLLDKIDNYQWDTNTSQQNTTLDKS